MGLGSGQVGGEGGVVFAHLLVHAELFELHVEFEDLFEEVGGGLSVGGLVAAGVLLADAHALKFEKVLGALDGVAEGAVGVVEERGGGERPGLFAFGGAGKTIRMELAAEAMELALEGGKIKGEQGMATSDRGEDLEVVDADSGLNLAAVRAKQGRGGKGRMAGPTVGFHDGGCTHDLWLRGGL